MKVAASKAGVTLEKYQANRKAGLKFCMRCRDWHPVESFGNDSTRYDGLDASCRESRNRRARELHVPVPDDKRKPMGPPRKPFVDGDKIQARHLVNQEVKRGKRPHPNTIPCVDCGHVWQEGERRHEYDHHKGYAAENHLEVTVRCSKCHAQRHNEKTICIRGHEYTEANTGITRQGRRFCLECRRARDRGRRDAAFWRSYRAKKKVQCG